MRLPDGEEVEHRPATDVDQVLCEEVVAERNRPLGEPEQGDVGRLAAAGGKGAVEAGDLVGRVAARGRQQADLWPNAVEQPRHVVAHRLVGRRAAKAVTAPGEDAARRSHAATAVEIASGTRGATGTGGSAR